MFAINHAATALILKKKFPAVKLVWLLISVQLVELLWVVFNFLGIEHTQTDSTISTVANIHLYHMPFSHSIMVSFVIGFLSWLIIYKIFNKKTLAIAFAFGVVSHIILDLLTHSADIPLLPLSGSGKYGLGLYSIPLIGFFVETAYGVICWWIYKGNWKLLSIILLFNISNISFFVAAINGPETLLANKPILITGIIFVQIIITLFLVAKFSKNEQKVKSASNKINVFSTVND